MPKLPAFLLTLLLATVLHLDWHVARPTHHRLSLGWSGHWVITAAIFAVVGWLIARNWPTVRWRLGGFVFVAAILLAQGLEPVLEVLTYRGQLGYPDDPGRWAAFGRAFAAAAPAYFAALWLCVRPISVNRASNVA